MLIKKTDTTVLNKKISEVETKIPNTSNLATTSVLNTKISEVENKVPDHAKYITTQVFRRMLRPIFCININTHSDRKWKTMQKLF